MESRIELTSPGARLETWHPVRLEIDVESQTVLCWLRSNNGLRKLYRFDASTTPTGQAAMDAINVHDGSVQPLVSWILEQLQALDPDLAGDVEDT
jgi:hypothetical protein